MKKPAILVAIPFDSESLSKVEYLQHLGDPAPSVFKKGDIITVTKWQKDHESKEKYWKTWWRPVKFYLTEVELLTWDSRQEDVRHKKQRLVYYPENKEVISWHSVDKSTWEKCRNIMAHPEQIPGDVALLRAILQNQGKCRVEWEENQCDGCKARIPLLEGSSTHKKPNDPTDPFGIGCTAPLYDRPKLTDGKISLFL